MQQVSHAGTVISSESGIVKVQMQACAAHANCTFSEKKEKIVDIDTPQWRDYTPGQRVNVIIQSGRGLQAVLIAYILPAVLLLATFGTLYALRLPELSVALASLAVIALYGALLYLLRHRLQNQFTFRIEKLS